MSTSKKKRTLKVLVACEVSQEVTKAFRNLGHEAYSCDIEECYGGHPEWHIQEDVLSLLNKEAAWDILIAFPPCDHLARSGARWWAQKRKDGRQEKAAQFFMALYNLPIKYVAVENPIGYMATYFRKPDQLVHPYMFGEPEYKSTCLWLKCLPRLKETDNVKHVVDARPKKYRNSLYWLGESKGRKRKRDKTFSGIAKAMAVQWSSYVEEDYNSNTTK